MYGKSNMEAYITICEIDGQQEFAIWLRKLKQGLYINLDEWEGEEMGGMPPQLEKNHVVPTAW